MTTTDKRLDDIVTGYIEAMLWAETDDNEEPLDRNYGPDDIAPETMQNIREVCSRFYAMVKDLDYSPVRRGSAGSDGYTDEEALGHDLWLTSRGHGVGFWEYGDWTVEGEEIGGEDNPLCQAAYKAHRPDGPPHLNSCGDSPYVGDDGLIYL